MSVSNKIRDIILKHKLYTQISQL